MTRITVYVDLYTQAGRTEVEEVDEGRRLQYKNRKYLTNIFFTLWGVKYFFLNGQKKFK